MRRTVRPGRRFRRRGLHRVIGRRIVRLRRGRFVIRPIRDRVNRQLFRQRRRFRGQCGGHGRAARRLWLLQRKNDSALIDRILQEAAAFNLLEVDAASKTGVDDTRELLENVPYAPVRGRYKVYLIDEVHMLSAHSFNALLKTLEEPPPHVKFLLATTDPQKLPATVLSR